MKPEEPLAQYALDAPFTLTPIDGGLINKTYLVDSKSGRFVLQNVNPLFKPEVHLDIEAVTAHLARRGALTPRLVRTKGGALWTITSDGQVWRLMSFVAGETHHRATSPALAQRAGEVVGRFHALTADLDHTFHFTRPGAHDTPKHLAQLEHALLTHKRHRHFERVTAVADQIFSGARALPALDGLPLRVAHGDLKLSNVLFTQDGGCLVDLDTLAKLPLPIELGDAWRSWCNPGGEDTTETSFDLALFGAAVRGYFAANPNQVSGAEREALVAGVLTIALELAARFSADALNESYFGWNAERFPDRGTHNLVRATGQLHVFQSLQQRRAEAERIVRDAG